VRSLDALGAQARRECERCSFRRELSVERDPECRGIRVRVYVPWFERDWPPWPSSVSSQAAVHGDVSGTQIAVDSTIPQGLIEAKAVESA
jgi:hypothetical protein